MSFNDLINPAEALCLKQKRRNTLKGYSPCAHFAMCKELNISEQVNQVDRHNLIGGFCRNRKTDIRVRGVLQASTPGCT